eukprot:scaffold2598_cov77-Phaeocystis_antarctica.AAC.3
MPRVYTTLLNVTRIRLRIIAIDCAWLTSTAVAVAAMMVLALTCEQDDRVVRTSHAGSADPAIWCAGFLTAVGGSSGRSECTVLPLC